MSIEPERVWCSRFHDHDPECPRRRAEHCPHHTLYKTNDGWFCGDCSTLTDLILTSPARDPHRDAEERIYQKSQTEGTETA